MKKCIVLILFFVFSCQVLFAQQKYSSNNAKAIASYDRSGVYIGQKLYNAAIKELEQAIRLDPRFMEAHFRMADILKIQGKYIESKREYLIVYQTANTYKNLAFNLAECYMYLSKYDSALLLLKEYSKLPDLSENRRIVLAKYLRDCEFSQLEIKNSVSYNPINLGAAINTINQEYLPTITADDSTLIFTRRSATEDFYISTKTNAVWSKSMPLSNTINTSGNEGAQCISPDGQYLFFAGCGRKDGLGKCDIYYSKLIGEQWSIPQNLGAPINGPYWESQPSLSADGKTLYFVSDRPGGFGSYDIYSSTYMLDGNWGNPINLGATINTKEEEFSPFIHADNKTLYFSSDGWPGFGEKDIFYSRRNNNAAWNMPKNLGYPINTAKQESSLFISNDGKQAYFASDNLNGYGGLDLYSFELYEAGRPAMVTFVKAIVFDKLSKIKLAAQVEIIELASGDTLLQTASNESTGQFIASLPAGKTYALNVNLDGYLFYSGQFVLANKSSIEPFNLSIALEPIEIGAKIELKNIFFENNSFKLKNESKYELLKLVQFLKTNEQVKIEISGHTDNVGDEKFNLSLSTNRAKSVFDYLLKTGIRADKMLYKGYGKSQPIDNNETEIGKANNRRTEIKIIAN